jgi:hypothetical protein
MGFPPSPGARHARLDSAVFYYLDPVYALLLVRPIDGAKCVPTTARPRPSMGAGVAGRGGLPVSGTQAPNSGTQARNS